MVVHHSMRVIVVSVRDLLLQEDPDREEDPRIGTVEQDQGQHLRTEFVDAHFPGPDHDHRHITDQVYISHQMLRAMSHLPKHLDAEIMMKKVIRYSLSNYYVASKEFDPIMHHSFLSVQTFVCIFQVFV